MNLDATAIESFPGMALLMSTKGEIVAANARGRALFSGSSDGGSETILALLRAALFRCVVEGRCIRQDISAAAVPEVGDVRLDFLLLPLSDSAGALVLARDQTFEHRLHQALIESRRRYKDMVLVASDLAWETTVDGTFAFVSGAEKLGYQAADLVGHQPQAFMLEPEDTDAAMPFTARLPLDNVEVWMQRADGRPVCMITAATPVYGTKGDWLGARGVCHDVTDQRERDAVLARSRNRERMLAYVVRSFREKVEPANMLAAAAEILNRSLSADGCQIFQINPQYHHASMENAFRLETAFGSSGVPEDVMPVLLSLENGAESVETLSHGWQILAAATRFSDALNGAVCLWRTDSRAPWHDDDRILIRDIARQIGVTLEQVAAHARIVTLSRTDALTGLLNRRAFNEEMGRRFGRLQRDGHAHAALIYADLDNFKLVNDIHGHKRGDEALLKARDILVGGTRPTDLVARLGGDEFALWLDGADDDVATRRARALLCAAESLKEFSGLADRPLLISLGIAVYDPACPESLEELLARADAAMYAVKRSGKGSLRLAPHPFEQNNASPEAPCRGEDPETGNAPRSPCTGR